MPKIRTQISTSRVSRARSAVGRGIKYRLGHGGTNPALPLPSKTGHCDCSGFISWVLGLNRAPKPGRNWWIETTNIYRDATSGKQFSTFVQLEKPEPGCLVVYPDRVVNGKVKQGHVALVVSTSGGRLMVIDCGMGNGGTKIEAIRERDLGAHFASNNAIYVCLRQDL